ncbi:MAG: rhamnulokinase [Limnochordales bacterium]|nr:rhamnulokinase [Limnochordales bacterium]
MERRQAFLAIDLGAESGRAFLGYFQSAGRGERSVARLELEEIHRFPNRPVRVLGHLHWDVLSLFAAIKESLRLAARRCDALGLDLVSVAIDTWGVDFGLLDGEGHLLANPFHYRDVISDGAMARAWQRIGRERIFEKTGIQFLPFNTIYQLFALAETKPQLLHSACSLLMMGELFTYFLTGERFAEFTNVTTTQLLDARRWPPAGPTAASGENPRFRITRPPWDDELTTALGIPTHLLPERLVWPGTFVGELLPEVREECGLDSSTSGRGRPHPVRVVAAAVHDTASAVAGIPLDDDETPWDSAFLSSGTWSLLGLEVPDPVITPSSLAAGLSNEGSASGHFLLLKNVSGLWLVQECRRAFAAAGCEYSYCELTEMARAAAPFRSLVDPDWPEFAKATAAGAPPMPLRIRQYCELTDQPSPTSPGEIVRTCLESLALKYRWVLEQLAAVTGRRLQSLRLHLVGGGSANALLNQFTADAAHISVVVGPREATTVGNILVQAVAAGLYPDLLTARRNLTRAFEPQVITPTANAASRAEWEAAYNRFLQLIKEAPKAS